MSVERSGAALLEVIAAMTILAVAGVAATVLQTESVRTLQRVREAETEMRAASAFLDAVALWPREDLDRRLGERSQGRWRLRIGRPRSTLYSVVLLDSTGTREILRTAVFRPESADER